MDAIEALKTRRCVRQFLSDVPDRQVLENILDCGRLAASARNTQPWEFVVVTDPAVRSKLASQIPNGPFIADAPVCIVVVCQEGTYYLEDGCAATQNILNAVHACGLGACWVAGDKKPYVDFVLGLLGVPAGYKLVSLIPLGYTSACPSPSKRPLKDMVHWENF